MEAHWNCHGHLLITVQGLSAEEARCLLVRLFKMEAVDNQSGAPVQVLPVLDIEHLTNLQNYFCGALAVWDGGPSRKHRRTRRRDPCSGYADNRPLRPKRQNELTRLFSHLGPEKLWVLSGFRRRGQGIQLENSSLAIGLDREKLCKRPPGRPRKKPSQFGRRPLHDASPSVRAPRKKSYQLKRGPIVRPKTNR